MPRKKRSTSPFELLDDDFDEDASSQGSRNGNPPVRNAANARERARMRVLSSAFGRLKTKLPNIPADTKLSKLDTLRLATMYIKQLKTVVEGGTPSNGASSLDDLDGSSILNDNCSLNLNNATQNMSWPFGFHHQVHNAINRLPATSSSQNNALPLPTTNWYQSEETNIKHQQQQRYTTDNYESSQHNHGFINQRTSPSSSYETTSSSLQTPVLNGQTSGTVWYSETPSPDLSQSPPLVINFDNVLHPHHQHQQQRNNLMDHLSLIQLSTPPPSSLSSSSTATPTTHSSAQQQVFKQNHQHNHTSHHQRHNYSLLQHHHQQQQIHQHFQQHHHLQSPQHLHQGFGNATSFTTAASIR